MPSYKKILANVFLSLVLSLSVRTSLAFADCPPVKLNGQAYPQNAYDP
jgi:hypothetical protein